MLRWLKKLWRDEEGATMVEYALMLALIAIVSLLVVAALGQNVGTTFQGAERAIPTVVTQPVATGQLPP